MSGPKYSRAIVELAKAQRILEQARIALEKEKQRQLTAEIQKLNKEILSCPCSALVDQCSNRLSMLTSVCADDLALIEYKAVLGKFSEIKAIAFSPNMDSTALSEKASAARVMNQKAQQLSEIVKQLDAKYAPVFEEAKLKQKEQAFKNTDWTKVPVANYCTIPVALQDEYERAVIAATESENAEDSLTSIRSIYENEMTDNDYKLRELRMRRQAIVTAQTASLLGELSNKQAEYLSLCTLLGKEAADIPQTLDGLNTSIVSLKEEYKQKSMAEYVSTALADSMKELGYSIESSETLQSKVRTIEKEVYDISESSHLNVSAGSDGAVMFEVVGKTTTQDKSAVKHDMEHFCPDYQKIKAHLKEKGVELTNEKLYPPSEEYVRFESTSSASGDRRARSTNQKRMYLNNG